MQFVFEAFGLGAVIAGLIVFLLLRHHLPAYLAEKGKNLATREDIAAITREIEGVRADYTSLAEHIKARHQLRLAALDRRLQVHQEAFALWRELLSVAHSETPSPVVLKCQAWWEQNCIYLEPGVREAFVDAYSSTHHHSALVRNRADPEDIKQSWSRIITFPDKLFKAVQLPALTDLERHALEESSGLGSAGS